MKNRPLEDVSPIENGDIPASYVSLPEGTSSNVWYFHCHVSFWGCKSSNVQNGVTLKLDPLETDARRDDPQFVKCFFFLKRSDAFFSPCTTIASMYGLFIYIYIYIYHSFTNLYHRKINQMHR